jgi:hypothetical protein
MHEPLGGIFSHMWVVRGGYEVILAHFSRATNFKGNYLLTECPEFHQLNAIRCRIAMDFQMGL